MRRSLFAGTALLAMAASPAAAETLRFAYQTDVNTLDPHGLNETFTLGFQGNFYEGLTRRGADLAIEPALATRWELLEPTRWRFHLREGVTFHDGSPFTADDVVFSAERARAEGSDLRTRLAGVVEVIAVDDLTVDFVTEEPNPIIHAEWDTWYIMDREWALANDATRPTSVADQTGAFAHRNANGTGPLRAREPGCGHPHHRPAQPRLVGRAPAQPDRGGVPADLQRQHAPRGLLSGEMDMVYPVPIQDVPRVDGTAGVTALTGPELRTMFLGLDQDRDELLHASVKGANPFKDRRVRLAVYQAIDMDAIVARIMRGQATPATTMVAPGVQGFPEELERHPYDPEAARALLAEAGYPDGFSVTLDCTNDRYVNDEAICQAIVGMLARVGIEVDLLAQTRSLYFAKVLAQAGYDTSFYMLGWTPSSFDSWNALYNLVHSRTGDGAGAFNLGGYSNPEIDALTAAILVEPDLAAREALIHEAWQILHDDAGYIPLHQQALAWGVVEGLEVAQRADNVFDWRHVRKN
jgi:peptide/nickel transport system substrate-binding protein